MNTRWSCLWGAVLLTLSSACAPSLRLARRDPPEVTLGLVKTMAIEVHTEFAQQATEAAVGMFLTGRIELPFDAAEALTQKLAQRLPSVGVAQCQSPPCDATLTVTVVESTVGNVPHRDGTVGAEGRMRARFRLAAADGAQLSNREFNDHQTGSLANVTNLLDWAADALAARFVRLFLPRDYNVDIPLEDGGPLGPAAKLLESGALDSAEQLLLDLATQQPNLAGTYYDLGVVAEARNDWPRALTFYRQAVGRDPKDLYIQAAANAERHAPHPQ